MGLYHCMLLRDLNNVLVHLKQVASPSVSVDQIVVGWGHYILTKLDIVLIQGSFDCIKRTVIFESSANGGEPIGIEMDRIYLAGELNSAQCHVNRLNA